VEALSRAPLRVGILIDQYVQPSWIARIIDDIQKSDFAHVTLVIRNSTKPAPPPPFLKKLARWSKAGLYSTYTALDEKWFRIQPDPFEPVDLSATLEHVPSVAVIPRATRFLDYFEDDAVQTILSHDLDVALRFGFRILRDRALEIARFGVWSYHHGDNLKYRGGPAGFWEVVEGQPVTGSILQILRNELDNGTVIYRSYSPTHLLSVWRNRQHYYWKTAAFVLRKLEDLHRCGPATLTDPEQLAITTYSRRLYRTPTNAEMLRFIPRLAARYVKYKWGEHTRDTQWFIAYKRRRTELADAVPDTTFYGYKHLRPPADRFWADPFPVRVGGRDFIFFEEFLKKTGRGRIACIEINESGPVGSPAVALETDYHLSYPNVFEWDGALHMVPETLEKRCVQLFRCVSFPDRWERVANLLENVSAVDPTMILWNGRWWLFIAMAEPRTTSWDELYVYHADSPRGPWIPHARNPVKSDVRSARPAGRFFTQGGRLLRPAQDGSRNYGHAIVINEVTRLDPDTFQEVESARIVPEWAPGLIGTHTLNASSGLTVIDGLTTHWRAPWQKA
jgi:hypothetical protein